MIRSDYLEELKRGSVVFMKKESGIIGWGNEQCVSRVFESDYKISLFGHNEHYKISDISKLINEVPGATSEVRE